MTTFKTGSTLTTGGNVGDTSPGITITFTTGSPAGQSAFLFTDYLNAPIFGVSQRSVGYVMSYGDNLSAYPNVLIPSAVRFYCNPGTTAYGPPALQFPDGSTKMGLKMWSGTGAPSASTIGGPSSVGDLYIRRDTPTTANQRIYQCTVPGTPGTWVGVA